MYVEGSDWPGTGVVMCNLTVRTKVKKDLALTPATNDGSFTNLFCPGDVRKCIFDSYKALTLETPFIPVT